MNMFGTLYQIFIELLKRNILPDFYAFIEYMDVDIEET